MRNAFAILVFGFSLGQTAYSVEKSVEKKQYHVCWSHYTGWEPWAYAEENGILKKWADKFQISIHLHLVADYIESINLFTSGKYQACTMTNMDALTVPAMGGVDSTVLIVGDYSNGNDGIIARKEKSIAELKGKPVKLVALSVSHYLLSRALTLNKMSESDVKIVNASDANIGVLFASDPDAIAVTWNPILMNAVKAQGSTILFDSSKIPGEILDLLVVKTAAPDELKRALTGAWYETMKILSPGSPGRAKMIASMARRSGSSAPEFKAQLKTTEMFYDAGKAAAFAESEKMNGAMEFVRTFSFDHGLFGTTTRSKELVGIRFANGSVIGNKNKVKLRFDATYMKMAAEGKL